MPSKQRIQPPSARWTGGDYAFAACVFSSLFFFITALLFIILTPFLLLNLGS